MLAKIVVERNNAMVLGIAGIRILSELANIEYRV
jgi:hypothetical protein